MARTTTRKNPPPPPPVQAVSAIRRNWVVLLPAATALIVGLALLLTSGAFGSSPKLLNEPGQTHIHTALLYSGGGQERILVGAHDGLYERSGALSAAGWQQNGGVSKTDVMGLGYNPSQPRRLYIVGHSIGVAVSDDGGGSWTNLLPGADPSYTPNDVHALAVDATDGSLYIWMEKKGMARSTDQGASWQPIANNAGGQVVSLLMMHPTAAQPVLYAGTTGGLLRSTDRGVSWQSVAGTWEKGGVYALANAGRRIYAGTPDGLYQSDDDGTSWLATANLPKQPVVGVSANLLDPQRMIVMFNDTSIFESSDGGTSWQAAAMSSTP